MISVCILGGNGSIGRALKVHLADDPDLKITTPSVSDYFAKPAHHDLVYYCIGMTSDFREFPFRTIEAHVEILSKVLESGNFGRLVYLSSTRLYKYASNTVEGSQISINPADSDSVYDISKLAGESLCLLTNPSKVRIVRISNVVAKTLNPNTFLGFLASSINQERLVLTSSLKSAKDFVDLELLLSCLKKVGFDSKESIYNVASGYNLRFGDIIQELKAHFNPRIEIISDESRVDAFPEINISRITSEFDIDLINAPTMIQKILAATKEFNDGN
jgi:nucleoside-diphosphate-sugar epimerase